MTKNKAMDALRRSPAIKKMRKRITRSGSEGTFETYLQRLKRFLEWAKLGPDEFLAAVESGEIYPPEKLNNFFDERDDAPKSLKIYVSAVKNFLKTNLSRSAKKELDWDDLSLPKMRTVETDKAPTREILKEVLSESRGIQDKVVPLMALSAGLRVGAIAGLTVGAVDFDQFPDVAVVKVPAELSKGGYAYTTFLTKEAESALIGYLDQRRRSGEEIGDGSPLIATPSGGFYSDPGTLSTRWGRMLDRAGLGEKGRRHRVHHFHTLRKFFRTSLERAGVSRSYRERLLGHGGEYLDVQYFDPEFDELMEQYRLAAPHLTIEETGVSEERIQTIEDELAEYKKGYEILKDFTVGRAMRQLEASGVDTSKTPHEIAKETGLLEAMGRPMTKEEIMAAIGGEKAEQKVIEESALVEHLSGGWKFVAQLNNGSGKVVVERRG